MKPIKKYLGKVSITCNGKWNNKIEYDRLCLVYNEFASYISKIPVPINCSITDEKYWQPVANLKEEITIDYKKFKREVIELIANINRTLQVGRLAVANMDVFNTLKFGQINVGAEVYIINKSKSYIIDSINPFNHAKTYHEHITSLVKAEDLIESVGKLPDIVADRAFADEYGNNIKDTYITKEYLNNFLKELIHE